MKSLNYVVYEHILIERVIEEVERMLTAVNVNRVFTQFLMLVLSHFIKVARTLLLNIRAFYYIINIVERKKILMLYYAV